MVLFLLFFMLIPHLYFCFQPDCKTTAAASTAAAQNQPPPAADPGQ